MKAVELTEFETSSAVLLSVDEVQTLRKTAPSISIVPSGPGRFELTPGSEIGVIHLGDTVLRIRPKLPIDRVLFLMSYALDPLRWGNQLVRFAEEACLVEAIAPAFVEQVRRAMSRGVLCGYRTIEDSLQTVRGALLFAAQLRRWYGRSPPAEVSFEEFTEDIDENRLLKAALFRLGRISIRSERARRSVRTFDTVLGSVTLVEFHPGRLPDVRYTRLNQHYRPAVELAKLVLRSLSVELPMGPASSWAFLVDMNVVFENFVVIALREELCLSRQSWPGCSGGRRLALDEGGAVTLQPDLSWWEGNVCTFVGDVKYKRIQSGGAKNTDLYQLLAYTVAANLPAGLLIYAAAEGDPATHQVVHLGPSLEVVALDLAVAPKALLEQVGRIGERVRRLRYQAVDSQLSRNPRTDR